MKKVKLYPSVPLKKNCNATAYKDILDICMFLALAKNPPVSVMVRCPYFSPKKFIFLQNPH